MRYIESINKSLHHLMEINEKVIVIGEDILDPYGGAFKVTQGLSSKYNDRVITTPISEASIFGFSTGLAMSGYLPILEIMFGDFITLCTDQIINGASKFKWMYGNNIDVPLVVRTPMGGRRGYGPTHSQTLETIYLSVPGIKIIAPSNLHNPGEILISAVLHENDPTLFIENKTLYASDVFDFVNGKTNFDDFYIEEVTPEKQYATLNIRVDKNYESDTILISYGGMTPIILESMKTLFIEDEIAIEALIPSLIKPIPIDDILKRINGKKNIIICEESIKTSGWGSEVSCQIRESKYVCNNVNILRIGSLPYPIPASKKLESMVLPQVNDIIKVVKNNT